MARADRLERFDAQREELEAEYRAALIAALQVTAGGVWGLFGHTKDRTARTRAEPILERLDDLAAGIDALRAQLGLDPFDLHLKFQASRGPVPSDAVGEPKQAKAWLERLGG
ncbi:MAG: hypothetical protein ABW039_13290 [Sphingobium sp.]